MTPIEPTRYTDGRPMLLAGLRRHHSFAGAAEGIPAQWEAFRRLGPLPGQQGATAFGVICAGSPEEQTFEYMAAAEVAEFGPATAELSRMRIAPQHYAVFEHRGPVSTLWTTWQAIWHEWLPRSGRTGVHAPDFEVYGEDFDPGTGVGRIEIWFPVEAV